MEIGDVSSIAIKFGLYDKLIEVSKRHGMGTSRIKRMLEVPVVHLQDYSSSGNVGEVRWLKYNWEGGHSYTIVNIAWHPLILNHNYTISVNEQRDQIIHELGHVVAILSKRHDSHGDEWKRLTIELGGTASIYHRLAGRLK
jgi:hypothetical protein